MFDRAFIAEVARHVTRISRVACVTFALAACGSNNTPAVVVEPNLPPSNYRAEILDYLKATLPDPTNIRDAAIAEPALKPSGRETRYVACLRYNAKGEDGTYTGLKERGAYFYAGRMTTIAEVTREQCAGVSYQPFPELEKLCRQAVCPPAR